MSALSSFTTMKVSTLFILLGTHSYYLQAGTEWILFGLEFPLHWLHLCQHSRHGNRKEPLLRVTCISSCLIFHSSQPTFLPFRFLVPQLFPLEWHFSSWKLKNLYRREWDTAECPEQCPPPGQVGDGTRARGSWGEPGYALPAPLPRGGATPRGAGRSSSSSICFAACLRPRSHVFNS